MATSWDPIAGDIDAAVGEVGDDVIRGPFFRYIKDRIHVKFADLTTLRLLDVGTGNGAACRFFVALGVNCTGIDASPEMIRVASGYRHLGRKPISYTVASLLEFDSGPYEVIVATYTLQDIEDLNSSLSRIKRLLSADGVCFVLLESFYYLVEENSRSSVARTVLKTPSHLPYNTDVVIKWAGGITTTYARRVEDVISIARKNKLSVVGLEFCSFDLGFPKRYFMVMQHS